GHPVLAVKIQPHCARKEARPSTESCAHRDRPANLEEDGVGCTRRGDQKERKLAESKSLSVSFPSARELLSSYWGLLANGGLVLPARQGLRGGDRVDVDVPIESSGQRCTLKGHVRRAPHDPSAPERVVIAFDPGEPQDMLLSAAWAEIENVPAR